MGAPSIHAKRGVSCALTSTSALAVASIGPVWIELRSFVSARSSPTIGGGAPLPDAPPLRGTALDDDARAPRFLIHVASEKNAPRVGQWRSASKRGASL